MKFLGLEITSDDVQGVGRLAREIYLRLRVPKNRKARIGIVICIRTESSEEENRVDSDIINELINSLDTSGLSNIFHIIRFPPEIAKKAVTMEQADDYLVRSRGHLMIYGDMVKRQIHGEPSFVFRLHG